MDNKGFLSCTILGKDKLRQWIAVSLATRKQRVSTGDRANLMRLAWSLLFQQQTNSVGCIRVQFFAPFLLAFIHSFTSKSEMRVLLSLRYFTSDLLILSALIHISESIHLFVRSILNFFCAFYICGRLLEKFH